MTAIEIQRMKTCEIVGIVFVTLLMVQLSNPSILGKIGVIVSAIYFIYLLIKIRIDEYQNEIISTH